MYLQLSVCFLDTSAYGVEEEGKKKILGNRATGCVSGCVVLKELAHKLLRVNRV